MELEKVEEQDHQQRDRITNKGTGSPTEGQDHQQRDRITNRGTGSPAE
jgi:hypothetical protein